MYDAICLASGGLDSMLCLHLLHARGIETLPAFVNYGQLNCKKEWRSLASACKLYGFKDPVVFDVSGFGTVIKTGLTDRTLRVNEAAFTPNRNLLFFTLASLLAFFKGVTNIVVGFFAERSAIFSDQTDRFLRSVESTLAESLGSKIRIHSPLRDFTKRDVVLMAKSRGLTSYYSCHAGTDEPCGKCIACLEYL